ncbi:MAG: RNA polymerase sigma factor [Acidimicrobiales bacterium]
MQRTGSEAGTAVETAALARPIGLEELAETSRPALLRAAQGVTGHREDAEDAVQASLLKAMGAWRRVEEQERWRQQAYVRQIVVNTCRSSWRKWGSRVLVGEMAEPVQVPRTDSVDDRMMVRGALDRLPARQRQVLLLRYWEDLSEAQIADRLGCAPGTVKSSAARALRALRDILADYDAGCASRARTAGARQRTGRLRAVPPAGPSPRAAAPGEPGSLKSA